MKKSLLFRFAILLLRGKQLVHLRQNEKGLADLLEIIIDNIKKKGSDHHSRCHTINLPLRKI